MAVYPHHIDPVQYQNIAYGTCFSLYINSTRPCRLIVIELEDTCVMFQMESGVQE